MSHRRTMPRPTRSSVPRASAAVAIAALSLLAASCGGGSGSDGGDASSATTEAADAGATTTAADDGCPAETTYEITGPDGSTELTAASAYAYESSGYLSIYLFSEEFDAADVSAISSGYRSDDPGTMFATLHTRGEGGQEAPIATGTYVADTAEAQQALEAGSWVTDVSIAEGLEPIAVGFPADPATEVTIDVLDDDVVCGTISHPSGTATFRAEHQVSDS